MTADELPVPEATSLAIASGRRRRTGPRCWSRCSTSLWEALRRLAGGRRAGRGCGWRRRTPRRASTVGREVRVDLPGRARRSPARATGIDPSGRLVVARDGERRGRRRRCRPRPRRVEPIGDMIRPWPSPRSCSTRASPSSSTPAPTPRRCCCPIFALVVFLAIGVARADADRPGHRAHWVVWVLAAIGIVWFVAPAVPDLADRDVHVHHPPADHPARRDHPPRPRHPADPDQRRRLREGPRSTGCSAAARW